MGAAIQQDGLGLGGIASLISTAAPLIFGTGTKKGTSTTGGTSTTTPTTDPALLAILQGIVDQSTKNANDPTQTADMVNNIIRQASVAFAPVLGQAGRSGLYNSSTVSKLASESVANATSAASQAVTSYKTAQQQIASQGAQALVSATSGKTTTTGQTTNETVAQSGAIPSQASSLLGIGLVGMQAWSQRKKLLDMLGLGSDDTTKGVTLSPEDIGTPWLTPPDAGGTPWADAPSISSNPVFASVDQSATPFTTGAADLGNTPIVGINSTSEAGGLDINSLLDSLPNTVSNAATGVGNFISGVGGDIADAGDSFLKSIADLFDF